MTKSLWFASLLFSACSHGALSVSPSPVEFGEIDFNEDMPDGGFNIQEVFLQNTGKEELELTLTGVDETRVLLTGQFVTQTPITLMPLPPGQHHTLNLGVVGYDVEGGERDTLVEGAITVDAPSLKEPGQLRWSFTPIRVFDDGSDD